MIVSIAFVPVLAVVGVAAVLLYFFPDLARDGTAVWLRYLNGYVVAGLLILYPLAAAVFAYKKAYKVAFKKMQDMHLLEVQSE